ncbi:MAG TPA: TIM barrel protein [Terriglobia bacterium]|nr:TIM barrel protein [Terriglobia bacterium]
MKRRDLLLLAPAALLSLAAKRYQSSRLAVEGYIFQQYAERQHKKLADVLDEIFPMAHHAGFRNIELNQGFLTPELRSRVLDLVQANSLHMPSVYVGGSMHQRSLAEHTISQALKIGELCKKFGCRAVINNPDPKPHDVPKTDAELAIQVEMLNLMGRELAKRGFQFWTHAHAPQMAEHAREWRYNLHHTDPKYVWVCLDIDWVYQGGQNPMELLREAGHRVASLHLRNSHEKVWLESFANGDIDYRQIASYLNQINLKPLLVVELAYRKQTVVTRPLEEDLRLSRIYAERVFGLHS